ETGLRPRGRADWRSASHPLSRGHRLGRRQLRAGLAAGCARGHLGRAAGGRGGRAERPVSPSPTTPLPRPRSPSAGSCFPTRERTRIMPEALLSPELEGKCECLLRILRALKSVAVAFSGGIDSTVVAKAAQLALGDAAVAVTADSPSVPRAEIAEAVELARQIGIRHRLVATDEFADPDYVRNDGARCYYCKSELYQSVEALLPELGGEVICGGATLAALGDSRPGLTAAAEHAVRHPLQEAGLGKADVRAIARSWGLPTWDKPASPCLSSRLAPGVHVTPERTARVEAAEAHLKALGLRELRVRLHEGELAR